MPELGTVQSRGIANRDTRTFCILLVGVFVSWFLPHVFLDPFRLFDLKKFLVIVTAIASIQFVSHILTPFFGAAVGETLSGFLGGFLSSTAVFASLPRRLRSNPKNFAGLFTSALAAILAMLIEGAIILLLMVPEIAMEVGLFYGPMILGTLIIITLSVRRSIKIRKPKVIEGPNPSFDSYSILKTGILLSIIFVIIAVSNRVLGSQFTSVTTFLTGLFEIHAVIYATASLLLNGELAREVAISNIILATTAGMLSKVGLLAVFERGRFAIWVSFAIAAMLACGWLTWYLAG